MLMGHSKSLKLNICRFNHLIIYVLFVCQLHVLESNAGKKRAEFCLGGHSSRECAKLCSDSLSPFMGFLWDFCGISMGFLWDFIGIFMECDPGWPKSGIFLGFLQDFMGF